MEREGGLPAGADDPNAIYDEHYYRAGLGPLPYQRDARWLGFFGSVADNLVRIFAPNTACDVGCAMGMLVESLWDRGVVAQGIDVSAYALSCVRPDMRAHCRYGSIVDGIDGRFDIVTCIEVLEHLPPEATNTAIANLCQLSDTIVFSSSPDDFAEPTHINVRPPLEWLRLFAGHGFRTDLASDASFIAPHAVVFCRAERYDDGEIDAFVVRHAALRVTLVERDKELGELRSRSEVAVTREREYEEQVASARAALEAARRELDTLRPALGAAQAELAAASKREEVLHAELVAAATERDASLARTRRSEREQARLSEEVGYARLELTAAEQTLRSERERSARESQRAAQLQDELTRLRNARLIDDVRRKGEGADVARLQALEGRFARLAEAYAERFG